MTFTVYIWRQTLIKFLTKKKKKKTLTILILYYEWLKEDILNIMGWVSVPEQLQPTPSEESACCPAFPVPDTMVHRAESHAYWCLTFPGLHREPDLQSG